MLSESLEQKLLPAALPLTDHQPGDWFDVSEPARPNNLRFAAPRTAPQMPSAGALRSAEKRAVAHHIMANHELQALEVMAWVLCRFPEAPADFRFGVATIMGDEQRHTRMHIERAERLGCPFGSLSVNCYIWKKARDFENVLDYLAGLPLVFEGANLDHTLEFAQMFSDVGDERGSAIMRVIHRDEIEHVAFGLKWLRTLKPAGVTDWEAFESHLHWPLRPVKARGNQFQIDARRAAGMDDDFIERLQTDTEE